MKGLKMDTEHLTEKHAELISAAQEIASDFSKYGEVLQTGDNGEYGADSAIARLIAALDD